MTEPDQPVDPLGAMIAAIDQMLCNSREIARLQKGLFDAYVEEGFSEGQALSLAALFLKTPDWDGNDDA